MPSVTSLALTLLLLAGIVGLVYPLWIDTAPASTREQLRPRFILWTTQGLLLPLGLWTLLNLGWLPFSPPLLPPHNHQLLAASLVLIASFWAAITLTWRFFEVLPNIPNPDEARPAALTWCVLAGIPACIITLAFGPLSLGFAALLLAAAALRSITPLLQPHTATPSYSSAEAHLKFNRNQQAEQTILSELERAPEDYHGWMMLAEVYATRFHDLDFADQTVRDVCRQPNVSPPQATLALHRLATWHLDLGQNPDAARRALQCIVDLYPNSHFAFMALQRINQIPASREELIEQKSPRILRLPTLKDPLDDSPAPPVTTPSAAARVRAEQLAARLASNPNAVAPREELAHLLAENLNNLDQAIQQMELLLNLPEAPQNKAPDWLATSAAWHLRRDTNPGNARRILERIVQEFPDSPQAFTARRRLQALNLRANLQPCAIPISEYIPPTIKPTHP